MPVEVYPLFESAIDNGILEFVSVKTYRITVSFSRFAILNALRKCGISFQFHDDIIEID
ncbi:MAG: hypothetical protein AABZ39_04860 [Spirochaetota bacterium]